MTKTAPKFEAPKNEALHTQAPKADTTFPTFEMPKFDAAQFDVSKMEVPAAIREAAEKTMAQAKDAYAKMKTAAEEATSLVETTYATASKGTTEFNLKALDNARTNINAAFDFARNLMGVKTLSEAVELQTSYLRAQYETIQAQGKDLQGLAQKVAADTAAPLKDGVEKVVKFGK